MGDRDRDNKVIIGKLLFSGKRIQEVKDKAGEKSDLRGGRNDRREGMRGSAGWLRSKIKNEYK